MATNSHPQPAMVEPGFFKQKDIGDGQTYSLTAYDVCIAASRIVGQGNIDAWSPKHQWDLANLSTQ